jgi:hypothetical protein
LDHRLDFWWEAATAYPMTMWTTHFFYLVFFHYQADLGQIMDLPSLYEQARHRF